jgi:hypothetical protein
LVWLPALIPLKMSRCAQPRARVFCFLSYCAKLQLLFPGTSASLVQAFSV